MPDFLSDIPCFVLAGGLDGASYKLREEQSSLLHDFDIVSQIAGLVSALKLHYKVKYEFNSDYGL